MILNDDIHWWYVGIAVLCLIPAIIASVFAINFMIVNNTGTRSRLVWACYGIIAAAVLLVIWNLIYFMHYYKKKEVTTGKSETGGEWTSTTKTQVFYSLLFAAIIIAWF